MRTARVLGALGAVALASLGTVALAAPANAGEDAAECRTSVTNLVDRPDSKVGGGTWALDAYTRTVQVCMVAPDVSVDSVASAAQTSTYHAVVTDSGTFSTLAGGSPQADVPLAAGITGTMTGGFTADFTAAPDFSDYNGKHDGKTYTGAVGGDNPSTGGWIASLFDGGIVSGKGLNNDWAWTYKTCTEQWVNAAAGNDGDITGSPTCPPPATTPAPTSPPPAAPKLPDTGTDVSGVVIAGGATLLLGLVLVWCVTALRRRARNVAQ